MPIIPPAAGQPLVYTAGDICTDALIEIGVLSPGEINNVDPDTLQWAFRKLNILLDTWATRQNFVPYYLFPTFTMVPNLAVHLIGPDSTTATWVVPQRPTQIPKANVILNNVTPQVEVPLTPRDRGWWMDQTIKQLPSQQPTDFFYNPAFPNGEIYFWPIPNTAYGARLELWANLLQFQDIADPIGGPVINGQGGQPTVPPGYRAAMMLSLAESLLSGSQKAAHPKLLLNAADARSGVFGLNTKVPNLKTLDSGLPGGDKDRRSSNFNWRSRQYNS